MSRMDAIKGEKTRAERGGSTREWYINEAALDKLGMKQYKAKVGTNFLRIIPPADEKQYFGHQIFVHYNIGVNQDAYLCPRTMLKEACSCCDRRDQLMAADAAPEITKALNCFPGRYLFFVVDVQNKETEALGPQLYDAPKSINDEILKLSTNRRTGEVIDISDPDHGKVLVFERTGTGAQNTKYSGYELEEGDPIPDAWLNIPEFSEVLKFNTIEMMNRSLGLVAHEEPVPEAAPAPAPAAAAESAPRTRRSIPRGDANPNVAPAPQAPLSQFAPQAPAPAPQAPAPQAPAPQAPAPEAGGDDAAARVRERLARRRRE